MVPKPIAAWIAGFALALSTSMLHAADLPKATQNILKKLKLTSEVMAGLDEELKVPQESLDGATKEAVIRILGTWDPKQFVPLNTTFHGAFPNIKVQYSRSHFSGRAVRTLLACPEGSH